MFGEPQPFERHGCDDDRVELAGLGQSGRHIAPKFRELQVRAGVGKQRPPTGRTGGDHRSSGQVDSRASPDEGVAGVARSGTAARRKLAAVTAGRSLAEWTATSARPARTAAWTSVAKMPLPPISDSGTSRRRSPSVVIETRVTSRPG